MTMPVIAAGDLVTAYGCGLDACWLGLASGRSALSPCGGRIPGAGAQPAGLVAALDPALPESLVLQMLAPMLAKARPLMTPDTLVILATTVGEIDLLEREVLQGGGTGAAANPHRLLGKIRELCGVVEPGLLISAACASGSVALAQAASLIRRGARRRVLVVAADAVTEFVHSGFSSLQALDPAGAHPFDCTRAGLCLGDAAGWILVTDAALAAEHGLSSQCDIAGWGQGNDMNHMTGPSRDGSGLARAIRQALASAGVAAAEIASISAHGTGTAYNDAMEIKGFRAVFGETVPPLYGIKGGLGHTLGAAGLVEALVACRSLQEQAIPPTVGFQNADPEASGLVSALRQACPGQFTLSTNSGFGGVNAALVLRWRESEVRQ
jgi:3-oxoacyl-[acyl-carrier-protein] synthase II